MNRLSVGDGKAFSIIDGELTILHEDEIEHVFERDKLSRAAYTYMTQWIQDTKKPDEDPEAMWTEAEHAWDSLTPELQGMLVGIANKEKQQARDIRDGLLATLHEYQGVKSIKEAFAEAIRSCFGNLI